MSYTVFPSVYGYNAGMRGKKGSPYEGGHHVPCFIHWPEGGLDQGMDFDGLSAHIDMLSTLEEICSLEKKRENKLDGISLWQYILGKKKWKNGGRTLIVTKDMRSANFILNLDKGKTRLYKWLTGNDGLSLGAYYVCINRIK